MKGLVMMRETKYSYEYIKSFIEQEGTGNGCKLVTNRDCFESEKIAQNKGNAKVKLSVLCKCGVIFYVGFSSFKNSNQKQCKSCGYKKAIESNTIPYENVKNYINETGCELITPRSEYIDGHSILKIKCTCGEFYEVNFTRFKNSSKKQCNLCSIKNRAEKKKIPFLEIKSYINNIETGNGCRLITKENGYIHSRSIINIKCSCGEVYKTTFQNFKFGNKKQCDKCTKFYMYKNVRFEYKEIKNFVEIESKSNCKLISNESDYINVNSKLLIQCECGNNYNTTFSEFKYHEKRQCNKCGRKDRILKSTKTHSQFVDEVCNLVGDEYSVIGEYKKAQEKILMRHNCDKCNNYEWGITPIAFLFGNRCPKCAHNFKSNTEEFKFRVYNMVKNEYSVLGEYKTCKDKIHMKHNECGKIWKVAPSNFLNGTRCPQCLESKGEQKIRNILTDNGICYKSQYTFEKLIGVNGGLLRFDFAIFGDPGKTSLKCLVEYDGLQHDKWIKSWMTKESFNNLQYHDKLKESYCVNNNYKLIRIKERDFDNIEQILRDNQII